jgi:hypothetical protein
MSYSVMKLRIEGLLSLKPARVVAHVGAKLQAGRAEGRESDAPASRELSTLCGGEEGWRGVGWDTDDCPGALLLAPTPVWGVWAGSREECRSRSVRGDILSRGRLALTFESINDKNFQKR